MRLRIRPPSTAATSARPQAPQPVLALGTAGTLAMAALVGIACAAPDAPSAGQAPPTAATVRRLCAPMASTTGSVSGADSRWAESGKCPVHTPLFQAWVPSLGALVLLATASAVCGELTGSVTLGVSGNACRARPLQLAGRPLTVRIRASPETLAWADPVKGRGLAARVASKSPPCEAVEPRVGTCNTKLPSCGMHSWRQTSHDAVRRMSSAPLAEG